MKIMGGIPFSIFPNNNKKKKMKTKQHHSPQQNIKLSTLDPERGSFQKNLERLCPYKGFQKGGLYRVRQISEIGEG